MKTTIYLIRHAEQLKLHGENFSNDSDQLKNEKIVISIKGEELAKKLSKLLCLTNIDILYASNYVRTISTAKYIAEQNQIEINIDERVGERKLGDLERLRLMGETKKNTFTVEQLLDVNLKNEGGESNLEVRGRMLDFLKDVLAKHKGKKIAVVSHSAAMKYLLQNWCEYDCRHNMFSFENKIEFSSIFEAPSIIELTFEDEEITKIEKINFNVN